MAIQHFRDGLDSTLTRSPALTRAEYLQEREMAIIPSPLRISETGQVFPPTIGNDEAWRYDAVCKNLGELGAQIFFPPAYHERTEEKQERESVAKEICWGCPARTECLDYALKNGENNGVWGGTNEAERRRILRQRKKQEKLNNNAGNGRNELAV
jgi:WhiB family redox-sensing transcriptional regulator